MSRIWKHQLHIIDLQSVNLPYGSRIISAANQNGILTIWSMVDPSQPTCTRHIEIFGTGHQIDETVSRRFIGTVLIDPFVWHVFERLPEAAP